MIDKNKFVQETDEFMFKKAVKLRDERKLKEALDIVAEILPKYPNNIAILTTAAGLNWDLGNLEDAIELFRSAVRLNPKSETVSLGLFHCLWEIGDNVEALDEVKRFMSISFSKDYMTIVREINKKTRGQVSD